MIEKSKFKINDIIVLFEWILVCVFLIAPVSLKNAITKIHIHVLILGILLLICFNANIVLERRKNQFLIILLEVTILFISVLKNNGGFGSIEFFIAIVLVFFVGDKNISISQITKNIIGIISTFCWIALCIYKNNKLNTNVASYQTFMLYIIMLPFFLTQIKSSLKKYILLLIATVIMVTNAMYYDCRTVLAGTIILFLLYMVPLKIWKLKITKKIVFLIITIGSLLMVLFYLYLYKNSINFNMSSFSHKSLYSGREIIWNYMINKLLDGNLLLGIGSNFVQYGFIDIGVHNYMLSVLTIFGIINFIIFLVMMYLYFNTIFEDDILTTNNKIYIIEIITLFFIDFFETHLIGAYPLTILLLITIFFYNSVEKNQNKEQGGEKYE